MIRYIPNLIPNTKDVHLVKLRHNDQLNRYN